MNRFKTKEAKLMIANLLAIKAVQLLALALNYEVVSSEMNNIFVGALLVTVLYFFLHRGENLQSKHTGPRPPRPPKG